MVISPDSLQVLVPFDHLILLLLASLAPLIRLLRKGGRKGEKEGERKGGSEGEGGKER